MSSDMSRKKLLELIKTGQVTPEEGYKLLQRLKQQEAQQPQQQKPQETPKPQETQKAQASKPTPAASPGDIAVIGMSGQFPGARNVSEYWANLRDGVDSIVEIPSSRWDINKYYDPNPNAPGKIYCKWGGFVPEADVFDPLFFNISPREAETMDPQQRLFLQEAWRALEDAGYAPDGLSGTKCGVFAGVMQLYYDSNLMMSGGTLDGQFVTGTMHSFLPARVSYFLNLTGPTMAIDTACSSSLVAIHQACQSIRNGESEMALAGGASILTTPDLHIACSKGNMLSKDGRCKTFDNSADGFVPAEGVAVVVLKSLEKALADRDQIYGVIKGSKVNQDGKTNGITAPSGNSQVSLATDLYEEYGIDPESISYMEAHGTGTKLGDPIEVSALTRSFRRYTQKKNYCAIGSVKTNIGHGLASAGVSGLIKILLCMKHGQLVPSLHLKHENEHLNMAESPFYVNTKLADWTTQGDRPRRAAISSFGLSGTNCHMVVEEMP